MERNRKQLVITIAVVFVLAAVATITFSIWNSRRGELDVVLQLQDTTGVSIKLNDKAEKVSGLRPTYQIRPGHYTVNITKPGYKEFSADFTIKNNDILTINAALTRTEQGTPEVSSDAIADVDVPGSSIVESHYFYQKTWALVQIKSPDGNTAWIIYKYDDETSTWESQAGPGSVFEQETLQGIPQDVVNYLTANNLVNEGVSQ